MVKPSIRTAIQYDPRHRGLGLALAYRCVPRAGDPLSHDLYGFAVGYGGGGCYEELYFHVGERREEGFASFTTGWPREGWHEDRIGFSGLANTGIADGVERMLESIHAYLFRRWLKWTGRDKWLPDLRKGAKRRLNCEQRRTFYLSPGFDEDLLAFISPQWGISLTVRSSDREIRRQAPTDHRGIQ